jgi:hypothetical protein
MHMHRILLALMLLLPLSASAASISVDTDQDAYGLGDTFIATVRIDNQGECINAGELSLAYPTGSLRAIDFSRGDSIFSLWVGDPKLDTDTGLVSFSGGTPGGYCGRVSGDPSESNILGRVVFSVVGAQDPSATISLLPASHIYLNDGLGTQAQLALAAKSLSIEPKPTLAANPWLDEVSGDTTPPEPFAIQIDSNRSVFNGKYYIVFSTTDKQSGLDHYEIHEGSVWKKITSPYVLRDQSPENGIEVRAIDKAGNIRLAQFDPGTVPPRQYTMGEYLSLALLLLAAIIAIGARLYLARRNSTAA